MANEPIPLWLLIRIAAERSRDFAYAAPVERDMLDDWLDLDLGDRLDRINHLAEHPTEDVRLEVEGYTETIRHRGWAAQLNAEPYDPWDIGLLADPSGTTADEGRLAGDENAAIRTAVDSDDLSFPFDPNAFRWTTAVDDFSPDQLRVRLGGEVVKVSAIATTAATFVATGTVAHGNNASVTPSLPAGVTANDMLLIFAAIRNSGTGIPQAPTGYTRLPIFNSTDNCQVFAKVHSGSESNPTVTFTGGVANADTSARMTAFRNMPITLTDLADLVVYSKTQLNASAQDIAHPPMSVQPYPGSIAMLFGWKQDDWTSVATVSGFTEAVDSATTTGDDQGIVWDYRIDTTPALVVAGSSFTVTGGASAISRSAVAYLAGGFQTMTVSERSLNGVVKSHAAATAVEVEDAIVMGL